VAVVEEQRFALAAEGGAGAAPAASGHGGGVEDGSGVAAVEDGVEALDDGFEEAVDAVGAGELEEGAEDLGGAKDVAGRRQGGGVEVVDEGADGEEGVWEVELAGAGGGGEGEGGGGLEGVAYGGCG